MVIQSLIRPGASFVALKVWYAARTGLIKAGGAATGGTFIQKIISFFAVGTIFDFALDIFGFDISDLFQNDQARLEAMIEEIETMARSGAISVANPRRGDPENAFPAVLVWDLSGNLNQGKPFLTWEYFSRNFTKAAVARERTRGFRGTRGRRQAQTRGNR